MVEEYLGGSEKDFFQHFLTNRWRVSKGALEEIRVVLSSMAGELTDGVEKAGREQKTMI